MCAKKGRVARIAKTLNRGNLSTALKQRDANAKKRGDDSGDNSKKSQWRKRKDRAAQREVRGRGAGV